MIIRTVLGDISPGDLGASDAPEQLFLDTPAQPGEEFLDVDLAVEEAQTLADAGARSVVEWTPLGCRLRAHRRLDRARALARAGELIGLAIANVLIFVCPDRVVVGGGVAEAGPLPFDPIRSAVAARARVAPLDRIDVVTAELGPIAGAFGAALWGTG